jgi:hypothetical protein
MKMKSFNDPVPDICGQISQNPGWTVDSSKTSFLPQNQGFLRWQENKSAGLLSEGRISPEKSISIN